MNHGSLGTCSCGYVAITRCQVCEALLCERHAKEIPEAPDGLSENAQIKFAGAVRLMGGDACVNCRADRGRSAMSEAIGEPRAPLPNHWLDRAIVLANDGTRSDQERSFDGKLPATLTPNDVAAEFLRRIAGKEPRESVAISQSTWLRKPDYAWGWKIEQCRKTEYTHHWPDGARERYPLPLMISVAGEVLGPNLENGDGQSAQWYIVDESDIDIDRLVAGVAGLLILSPFEA